MLKTYYACRTVLRNYNHDVMTTVIRLDTNDPNYCHTFITEPQETLLADPSLIVRPDCHYLVGPAADRLFAYEQLGFTPEELANIIERDRKTQDTKVNFHDEDHVWIDGRQFISLKRTGEMVKEREERVSKRMATRIAEINREHQEKIETLTKLEPPAKLPQDVISLIDDAMEKKDRYVSLFYGSAGISIDIYPMVEETTND